MTDHLGYLQTNIEFLTDTLKLVERKELAEAIGVTVTAIGQLIRGESKGMKPHNLVRAATRLGVTVEELVLVDFRNDPSMREYLAQISTTYSIGEESPAYASRIRSLYARLNDAAKKRQLALPELEHIERTLDLVLKKH